MDTLNLKEEAKKLMLENFEKTGRKYIAPSWSHYKPQWLWDSCFHAIICANSGLKDLAKNEIEELLLCQREDGWIPHIIYHGFFKRWDFEGRLYSSIHNGLFSSITQPPVLAQAVEAINDPEWAKRILDKVLRFYLYFKEKQDPDNDDLISICHPCESGRDASPEFDQFYWKPSKKLQFLNPAIRLLNLLNLERKYRKVHWDIQEIWGLNLFNIEDLMTHCIWLQGLRSLGRLMRQGNKAPEDIKNIEELADKAEKAVIDLCWDEKDGIFWSLDSRNQKIKTHLTISNLFPIILEKIPERMISWLVVHLRDEKKFWTSHPIPSVAVSDSAFNPESEWLLWRGPVWINANWFIVNGLRKHGYNQFADEIAQKTKEMVAREGFREFYNPFTGKGRRVKNFGWSALAALM